jgi:hypothetical protein
MQLAPSRDSRSVPIGCRAHHKVGDPVLVDQVEDAIVDMVVLREEEFRLHLGPAAEGEVGEEDPVRLFLLGLAMGEHQLLRGLGRRDLPHCIFSSPFGAISVHLGVSAANERTTDRNSWMKRNGGREPSTLYGTHGGSG